MASALNAAFCAQKWDRVAKGPAWAAGTDMTKLLQLCFPPSPPGSVVTAVGNHCHHLPGVALRVSILELLEVCGVTSCKLS